MKKILLSFSLLATVFATKAQTVLNEVYTEPGSGKSEFFELYNSAVASQNVDCFTIVTYWESGANVGIYVLDLPNVNVAPKGWFTGAASSPFAVQSLSGVTPGVNWNDINFRNGSTNGYLKKYQLIGGVLVDQNLPNTTQVMDLLVDVAPTGASGHNYFTFVYVAGVFSNGFWGGGPNGTLPSGITSLPTLVAPSGGGTCGTTTINFGAIGAVEFVNSAPGSDNGYARTTDGKCGAWVKTSAGVQHTPNASNGGAAGLSGALTTAEIVTCASAGNLFNVINFDITAISGGATEADDFAVEVQLYLDKAPLGQLDGNDIYQRSEFIATVAAPADTFKIPQTQKSILVYKTKRGCFDRVVVIANPCAPLPVHFKSFTATRSNSSNVVLKWETATEQNAAGFGVERNVKGGWEQVAYVPSQAVGGNSNSILTYQLNDLNSAKGVSQYRIRQEDLDGVAKLSDIRSVRGEGQKGSTIVYPNPSDDGKVNVVFAGSEITKRNVTVQDMSGRIVKQWSNYANNNIQIENLTPGFYTIRIVDIGTGEQSVEKVVVNKR